MNWRDIYINKLVTAEEAVSKIKSNDRVVFGHAVAEPMELVNAIVKNKDNYENVEIIQMLTLGKGEYLKPEMNSHFRLNSLFVGPATRNSVKEGQADFTPCFFRNIPKLFENKYLPVDVSLIKVSTPDANGFCSFGVSNDYTKPSAHAAKFVIAEVNDKMPRALGDSFIHVSDIDYIVETSYPLPELKPPVIGTVEKAIGKHCASLIDDGSTLQLGIGAIPDAVLLFLKDKKDLGIHSEMISDGVVELVDAGVITNKRKTLHKEKIVITFCMGTKRLYDFIDNNPMIEMYPVNYVNDPTVIAQNYKMVCINSALQVDLLGQVAADTIGLNQFSAVGGQVDFVRGADMAKDGKSIIALPSTAANGKLSRIVSVLDEGSAITTSRNDVEYIVTEYGIANLRGKSLKERGKALINIAHPDYRQGLTEEWEKRFNTRKA